MSRKTRTIPTSTTRFSAAIRYRKVPETLVPMRPVTECRLEPPSSTGPASALTPTREEQGEDEDDGRVAQREEEPDAQRPLALAHELARRVVDRRDVVGVERVAQPERVGREPDPRRERATGPEAEVVRHDEAEQQPEADDVQADDGRREAARARPLGRGE